jgi:hypothetical protein
MTKNHSLRTPTPAHRTRPEDHDGTDASSKRLAELDDEHLDRVVGGVGPSPNEFDTTHDQ